MGRRRAASPGGAAPGMHVRVVHLTTTDMSLALLLGPQLRAFVAAGYEVIGLAAPSTYVSEVEATGASFVPLRHATRAMDPVADVRLAGELVRTFRRLRPDVVHTHNPKPGVLGRVAARVARVPVIVNTVHGLYAQPSDGLARRTVVYGLERVAAACSHAELVQNPEDLETLAGLGVPRSKLTLLGNGIDLSRFDPSRFAERASFGLPDDVVVVGAVGRLVWEKGYRELFSAAAGFGSLARLVVVGPEDGDKDDAVDAASRAAASAAGVTFLGARDDVDRLYTGFDIYVLASHREGFPRSAMEAAAMGVPIVATDIRGCRQVVDHGVTGFLVPVGDAEAMARAVRKLASDPALRAEMGAAGRAKALREFDDRRVVDITLATYSRLLGG